MNKSWNDLSKTVVKGVELQTFKLGASIILLGVVGL